MIYLKLSLMALLPVAVAIVLYILEKKTKLARLSKSLKQVICGVVFGGLAVLSTEFGVDVGGAVANVRDACVLIAGLVFGPVAGLVAGFIGGVERWFAVYWGAGTYTRWACSISTVLAGIIGAVLRKYMFDDKKPSWLYALGIGVVTEDLHMLMIFFTNMNDIQTAFSFVTKCALPMIVVNGVCAALAVLAVTLLSKESWRVIRKDKQISSQFQRLILLCVVIATVVTGVFTYVLQSNIQQNDTEKLLALNISDVKADIDSAVVDNQNIDDAIKGATQNRHIGEHGCFIVVDEEMHPVTVKENYDGTVFETQATDILSGEVFRATVYGEDSFCMFQSYGGYYIVAVIPVADAVFTKELAVYVTVLLEIVVFVALFILIYFLVKKLVVDNIRKVNDKLAQITGGNLSVLVDVRTNEEFASLSDDINTTVVTLKKYISEAEARIDKELEFAKSIQHSALPSVFPPFPTRKEFDVYASMDAAKEVGGDFYDFYFVGQDELAFLVADVSGKGIPAAMFMMRAKTLVKSYAEAGQSVERVLTAANAKLCEGNDADMFVTAWLGKIDLKTGLVTFANAGHNPPLVKHADGSFEFLKVRAGFVLAEMDSFVYKQNQVKLEKGDTLFLYTDGVTEATNGNTELFGEKRLKKVLDENANESAQKICVAVKNAVDDFVGDAPQFDDITMLCLEYKGESLTLTLDAKTENIDKFTDFVDGELEKADCPMKAQTALDVALDEILSNICRYAYDGGEGKITLSVAVDAGRKSAELVFEDHGKQFNPLLSAAPDVDLPLQERKVGGLGIYIVKKSMDEVAYDYKNGANVLTIKKKW